MADLFDKFLKNMGPLGKWASVAEGYFVFPKLEGQISNRMKFNGKEVITWSVNDYLGLSNHPEVREIDAQAARDYGSAYPMGARMMSGHTEIHEKLEEELAEFVNKESAYVLNFGYQESIYCLKSIKKLREFGIIAELYPDAVKLKKQISYANKKDIPYVALVGDEEIKQNKITLKKMSDSSQKILDINELTKMFA